MRDLKEALANKSVELAKQCRGTKSARGSARSSSRARAGGSDSS
jgi:hypothetical protein